MKRVWNRDHVFPAGVFLIGNQLISRWRVLRSEKRKAKLQQRRDYMSSVRGRKRREELSRRRMKLPMVNPVDVLRRIVEGRGLEIDEESFSRAKAEMELEEKIEKVVAENKYQVAAVLGKSEEEFRRAVRLLATTPLKQG